MLVGVLRRWLALWTNRPSNELLRDRAGRAAGAAHFKSVTSQRRIGPIGDFATTKCPPLYLWHTDFMPQCAAIDVYPPGSERIVQAARISWKDESVLIAKKEIEACQKDGVRPMPLRLQL